MTASVREVFVVGLFGLFSDSRRHQISDWAVDNRHVRTDARPGTTTGVESRQRVRVRDDLRRRRAASVRASRRSPWDPLLPSWQPETGSSRPDGRIRLASSYAPLRFVVSGAKSRLPLWQHVRMAAFHHAAMPRACCSSPVAAHVRTDIFARVVQSGFVGARRGRPGRPVRSVAANGNRPRDVALGNHGAVPASECGASNEHRPLDGRQPRSFSASASASREAHRSRDALLHALPSATSQGRDRAPPVTAILPAMFSESEQGAAEASGGQARRSDYSMRRISSSICARFHFASPYFSWILPTSRSL